jgi:hypothetical protein
MIPKPDVLPDYHFLVIAPNLGGEWLFDAGRLYWEAFRPIVVSDLELPRLIPNPFTVIVTAVVRRDIAAQWGVWVAQTLPNALFDPISFDLFDEMKAALNARAASNQPFGVPLMSTATPVPPISPTPGSIIGGAPVQVVPTRPAGGFVTQTPTPGGEVLPTGTPEPTQGPLYPTPGAITGG